MSVFILSIQKSLADNSDQLPTYSWAKAFHQAFRNRVISKAGKENGLVLLLNIRRMLPQNENLILGSP